MTFRSLIAPLLALLASLAVAGAACAQAAAPQRASLVGKTMQPATVDLQQLRGKVVMLFFWSTACPVCLDKLPELRRNLQGWRGKDFVIVAVSQDRSVDDLKAYEQVLDRISPPDAQMKIVWRRDPAHRDSFGELPSNSPTTFVLDRNGVVSKQVRGRMAPELWDDVAELILN
jgi:peroxiredoxin